VSPDGKANCVIIVLLVVGDLPANCALVFMAFVTKPMVLVIATDILPERIALPVNLGSGVLSVLIVHACMVIALIQSMEMDIALVKLGGLLLTAVFALQDFGVQIAHLAAAVTMQYVRMDQKVMDLAFANLDGRELPVLMPFPMEEEIMEVL